MAEKSEQDMQQKYMELQMLQKKKEAVAQTLEGISTQMKELEQITEHLKDLKDVKAGTKTIIPLANGIFAEATINNTESLIVNVGANACVKRPNAQVQEMLQKQLTEMKDLHQKVDGESKKIDIKSRQLHLQLQELAK